MLKKVQLIILVYSLFYGSHAWATILASSPISANDVQTMRDDINTKLAACGLSTVAWPAPNPLTSGTIIRASHFDNIKNE